MVEVFTVLLSIVAGTALLAAGIFLLVKLFGFVWLALAHVFNFIGATCRDAVRLVGTLFTIPIFALFVVCSIIIGRWSASAHYGRAFSEECKTFALCCWRLVVGNPARLVGLGGALEGIEQRIPAVVADAPGRDKPRQGMFEGYEVVGSLPGGGSGAKLYVAQPNELKRAAFARRGVGGVDRVVIKVFSQRDGSTLDQIVRESRALEAAKNLGLVLEHQSEPERFYYVMRYVPGDSLSVVTQRLHGSSAAGDGLDDRGLAAAMAYAGDLLRALSAYHAGGLWHKDVKPDNIIIETAGDGRAHLVDFGLVTPMRSAMTLTTHGTEYFRDPELVRQALRGAKVHEIDGRRFDIYAAGAVIYSVIENSFPAHSGLSQITRRCPDALRWIVRRAMTDYDKRYETADAMLADLEAVRTAPDPFALRPADLPSVRQGDQPRPAMTPPPVPIPVTPPPVPPQAPRSPVPPAVAGGPRLRMKDWWTGRYEVEGRAPATPRPEVVRPYAYDAHRTPAAEQLAAAHARVRATRKRARQRIADRRAAMGHVRADRRRQNHASGINGGSVAAVLLFIACFAIATIAAMRTVHRHNTGASGASVSAQVDGAVAVAPRPDLPALQGVRMLVVSDLGPHMADDVEHAIAAFRQQGVETFGDFPSDPDAEENQIALVAFARAARGAVPIDDPQLGATLQKLLPVLRTPAGEPIDGVFWIGSIAGDDDNLYYVFSTREATISGPTSGHVAGKVLGLLEDAPSPAEPPSPLPMPAPRDPPARKAG